MTSAVYVARLSCGCAIDACEECLDPEALTVRLYHWTGNGYTVECVATDGVIETECAACRDQGPRMTQRMFS
jgi:hypothetical protein